MSNLSFEQLVMDNGPAQMEGFAQEIQRFGHDIGDPFELSTIRRDVSVICFRTVLLWSDSSVMLSVCSEISYDYIVAHSIPVVSYINSV